MVGADGWALVPRVVAPILISRVHYAMSDIDTELGLAHRRLDDSVRWAEGEGFAVSGEVCPDGPLVAIEDQLRKFAADETKSFKLVEEYAGERADLTLSLDVIFHLVEDQVFTDYMKLLFDAADRYVIVYATNTNRTTPLDRAHVRHRRFTDWTATREGWRLEHQSQRRSPLRRASFFVFART